MKRFVLLIFLFCTIPVFATTWYVRPDGGTRYSVNEKSGQCNGMYNAAYPGAGVNQNCAFGDIRYLWADGSRENWGWVGAGGDKYLIDCPTDCRVGFSGPNDTPSDYFLGRAGDPYGSGAPVPPSGTASAPTQILGANFANCASDNAKAHINGGYGTYSVFNLSGASYVNLQCMIITDHSQCTIIGKTRFPSECSTSSPRDDYADAGVTTNDATSNILFQDIAVHGMVAYGFWGPIGGPITMNRVRLSYNAVAGWMFDDGNSTPDAPGSVINASYVTIEWSGCNEEYPIVHPYPAISCYDDVSGGFGDAWSAQGTGSGGQHSPLAMTCDHCIVRYNTKDGFGMNHIWFTSLSITNSLAYANMGQQWKWGSSDSGTTLFENNLVDGNCKRMSSPIEGTPTTYNKYLSDFCRAAGDINAVVLNARSSATLINNTVTGYGATMWDLECQSVGNCSTSTITSRNNLMLGYSDPSYNSGRTPGAYYRGDSSLSLTRGNNLYHNLRNDDCPTTGFPDEICSDPLLVNEPASPIASEAALDGFNFNLTLGSSAIGAGMAISGITTDYNGNTRPDPPSIGAVEYGSKPKGEQIAIEAGPNPAAVEQPVTLTVTVAQTGSSVPTGSINFQNGSESLGRASLDSTGTASLVISWLPIGSYSVVGAYSGDSNYPSGESGADSLEVLAATTTSLSVSPNPVTAGQALVLTAKVTANDSVSPTGTVTFLNGSTLLGTSSLNSSGVATLSTASLAPGTYSLTAKYGGNGNSLTSTSSAVSVTVKAESTTTSLSATPNPVAAGRELTLTATVKGSTISPTGTVSFMNDSTVLGTSSLNSSGVATLSTESLAAGTYRLTAKYDGNENSLTSTSSAVSVTVTAAAQSTKTSLAATPNPVAAGRALTLTATVKGSTNSPTGKVSFMDGSTLLGTDNLSSSGVATISTSSLAAGTYRLTAKYDGNSASLASTSSAVSVTVTAAAQSTTTSLAATPNPVATGRALTLTATVKGSTISPTGTVSFMDGSTLLGTDNLSSSGVATISTSSLAAGTYHLTAKYAGNATSLASTSTAVSVTVTAAAQSTTTNLTAAPSPVATGQPLVLSATVKESGPKAPTGTVSFMNGSTLLGTGNLNSSGVATLSTESLDAGTYRLTAEYAGSSTSLASTSSAVSVTVTAAAQSTTTNLTTAPSPIAAGQPLVLSATVKVTELTVTTAERTATEQAVQRIPQPTGTVSFGNGSKLLGTVTLDPSGVATLSTASLAPGTYSLTAEYSGSPSFLPSVSPAVSVTANAAAAAIVHGFILYAPGSAQSEAKQTSGTALCKVAVPASGSQPGATVTYLSEDGSCGQQASR